MNSVRYAQRRSIVVLLVVFGLVCSSLASTAAISHPLHPAQTTACLTAISPGDTFTCSLSVAGETDSFTLNATSGDRLFVRVRSQTSALQPSVQIASGSTTICQGYSYGAEVILNQCVAPADGSFTISIKDYSGNDTGGYSLFLQKLNAPQQSTALVAGPVISATLLIPGEVDTYTFAATEGDRLLLRMGDPTSAINPQIYLYNADGVLICHVYSSSEVVDLDSCPALNTEMYTLLALNYASSATGTYALTLQRTNNPANATPLAFGNPASATFAHSVELDAYSFSAQANDRVVVRIASTNSGIDPQLRLYGPTGLVVCEDKTYALVLDIAECLLPETGIYSILVNDYNGDTTGSYGIMIQRTNNPSGATILPFGQSTTGIITATAHVATYVFTAEAGDTVFIRGGSQNDAFDPYIRIYDPNGTKICSKYRYSFAADVEDCLIPTSGIYTLLLNDYDGAVGGTIGLTAQVLNRTVHAQPLYVDRQVSGSLGAYWEADFFTFTATAESTVSVKMQSSSYDLDPQMRVYAPNGTRICAAYGVSREANIAECVLPSDGSYTVVASHYLNSGTGSGTYALDLMCLTGTCGPQAPPLKAIYLPLIVR